MSVHISSTTSDVVGVIAAMTQRLGRPLRVLHLGNVANYAYVNAKIMRNLGIEAHVFDPDFFHIMATPEWQEAKFEANFNDQFKPIWRDIELGDFTRPHWFVQGPFVQALAALAQLQGPPSPIKQAAARFNLDLATRRTLDDFRGDVSRFLLASGHPVARGLRAPLTLFQRFLALLARPKRREFQVPHGFPKDAQLAPELGAQLASVLNYYDIVHGYTLSGHLAAQIGHPRYIACELGTLRGLPFEDSPSGRLCAWLYLDAPEVMITNSDCVASAKKLKIPAARTTAILHPYDVDGAHADLGPVYVPPKLKGPPIFFAPARHHWAQGNASWLKGNHIYLQALGQLAQEGHEFRLITVDWGQEADASRALIEEVGLTSKTQWISPAPRRTLWRYYQGASAVIDQFNAESFGGAGLDAMFVGRRLITRFAASASQPFFDTAPPIPNATSVEDVVAAARAVLADPIDQAGKGKELYDWVRTHHGLDQQLGRQFEVYLRLLTTDA